MANFIITVAMLMFVLVDTTATAASNYQPCQNRILHVDLGRNLLGNMNHCYEWYTPVNSVAGHEQNEGTTGSNVRHISTDINSADSDWLLSWSNSDSELPSNLDFSAFFKSEQGYREYLFENQLLSLGNSGDSAQVFEKNVNPGNRQLDTLLRPNYFASDRCAQKTTDPECSSGQSISEPELLWIIGSALLVFVGFPRRFSKSI